MSKTPDEIKKGLEICNSSMDCNDCPYLSNRFCIPSCKCSRNADALAYIQQLETERDALFKEVRGRCSTCKHWDKEAEEEPCASCVALDGRCHNWQWRGVQKEG